MPQTTTVPYPLQIFASPLFFVRPEAIDMAEGRRAIETRNPYSVLSNDEWFLECNC